MYETESLDVVIVGAGISGINSAYRLQTECPNKSFMILESRSSLGGTWDLFKYPGIRSDSDMLTLGFDFNPWQSSKPIAEGEDILNYLKETAGKFGIDKKIQFNSKLIKANWLQDEKVWVLDVDRNNNLHKINCNFLIVCTGYYNYNNGYLPDFKGINNFEGTLIHPQNWDPQLDYTNKNIVVIGSGATAVTLVPSLAKKAKKVTMLQRTPTYILAYPNFDPALVAMKKILPDQWIYKMLRWRNIIFQIFFYQFSKLFPKLVSGFLKFLVKKQLGNKYNNKDFSPPYNPWDQRLCLDVNGRFFTEIKKNKVEIATDSIKEFTKKGILLEGGKELEADIVVTATGLNVLAMGGVQFFLDDKPIQFNQHFSYKGILCSNLPNFAYTFGYINASWTLRVDVGVNYFLRILKFMDKNNYKKFYPKLKAGEVDEDVFLPFNPGYILRSRHLLPKQGKKSPWRVYQNYILDLFRLSFGSIKDKYLTYEK